MLFHCFICKGYNNDMITIKQMMYFTTVCRTLNITKAAEELYVSQPALSLSMKELEKETGCRLFTKQGNRIQITEEGRILNREFSLILKQAEHLEGMIRSGTLSQQYVRFGFSSIVGIMAAPEICHSFAGQHPELSLRITEDIGTNLLSQLDNGLLDFGLMFEPFDMQKYETMLLPFADTFGFLMQESHPLAQKKQLRLDDLEGVPLLMPSQGLSLGGTINRRNSDYDFSRLNIVCHYNLLFNAAVMVEQGMGIAFCLDHLVDTAEHTGLTFRPLYPSMEIRLRLAWKKYQIFTPAAELFLRRMRQMFETET